MLNSDGRQLFKGTAEYYSRYRFSYPKEFFGYITDLFHLDKNSRALDLGCGTGQIAIPLADIVGEVVGVDYEQDMLDEAENLSAKKQINNIRWILDKAENIDSAIGNFHITTMGASFHWMNQSLVLEKIYRLTEPGGGVGILSHEGISPWSKDTNGWQTARIRVLKKYLGDERRAGNSTYQPPERKFEDLLMESPFGSYEEWSHTYTKTQNLEEVVNYLYSTSFAQKSFFGEKIDEFEHELRDVLMQIEPLGVFSQEITVRALIASK